MIKNKNKPTAILTADWHLRDDTPIAYVDDFQYDQWEAVDFVSDLQKKYECPVLCSGDLFDHWKPSPQLLSEASKHMPARFMCIAGNHDLPQHNLELIHKSGIYNLSINKKVEFMKTCSYGQEPDGTETYLYHNMKVLLWHIFTYQGQKPWMDCTSPKSAKLLRQHPEYDLIVTGDNHAAFVEYYDGRVLVNPGSLMRQDASQYDFEPRVYLWYADSNTVEPVFLPINKEAISKEHLVDKKERDERISAFVSKLNTNWTASLSFEDNLKIFEQQNKIHPKVMEVIYQAIES